MFDLCIDFYKEENVFHFSFLKINSWTFLLHVLFCNNYLYIEHVSCVYI